jgi:hypothetical protein
VTIELGGPPPRVDVRAGAACLTLTVSGRGAATLVLDRGDTRCLAVWEPLRADPDPGLRGRLARALRAGDAREGVDECARTGASVVITEVRPGGDVHVVGWAAPSVLRVSAARPGLVPLNVPTPQGSRVRLDPGDLLVLCSPGLLVQPPACLHADVAAQCPAGGQEAWDWARRGLVDPLTEGAVALVRAL